MMNGVCVIGDSSTGAIVQAERLLNGEKVEAVYFVAMHNAWGDVTSNRYNGRHLTRIANKLPLDLVGSDLRPSTKQLEGEFVKSANHRCVTIDDYEAFVLADCTFSPFSIIWFLHQYRPDRLPAARPNQTLVSEACFERAVHGLLEEAWSIRIAKMIRKVTSKPIYVIPEPFAGRVTPLDAQGKAGAYNFAEHHQYSIAIAETFDKSCRFVAEQNNIEILQQPPETVQDHIFTRKEFSRYHQDNFDPLHCNHKYGSLIVRQVVSLLASESARTIDVLPGTGIPLESLDVC